MGAAARRADGSGTLSADRAPPATPVNEILALAERASKRAPLTAAIVPRVAAKGSRAILAEIQTRDPESRVFLPLGAWPAIQEAWPYVLLLAKRVVVVPGLTNALGSGSVWQIDTAKEAGVPVFAFDRNRRLVTSRFEVDPIDTGSRRVQARIVFASV